jgi:hypothetical protein
MSLELKAALREKMRHLEKMRKHLVYSRDEVAEWWSCATPFGDWSERQLASLVAFKSRFAELQDHLASAMRVISSIENEDVRLFTYVLNYMDQIGVLDDMLQWQKVRDLRNAATHDYSEEDEIKAQHFESLLQNTSFLLDVFERMKEFALVHYPVEEVDGISLKKDA